MTNREPSNVVELPRATSITSDQWALAALLVGSLGTLYALRRGLKGIGNIELTGSTIAGVEFAALFIIVGTGMRLVMIQYGDKPLGRALAFVH